MNDPFAVLGVSPSATEDEIKSAYRKLAKKYHPDLNPGDKVAEQKMREVNEAYTQALQIKKGGGSSPFGSSYGSSSGNSASGSYGNPYGSPFGSPFGYGNTSGGQSSGNRYEYRYCRILARKHIVVPAAPDMLLAFFRPFDAAVADFVYEGVAHVCHGSASIETSFLFHLLCDVL